ncbi:MAG: circularly permuted type 2 ATP-grasp protein [Pirellulaceae bacterium]
MTSTTIKPLSATKRSPNNLLTSATTFRHQMKGFSPTKKVWCHVTGVDLVRDGDGTIYVLEDNLRCPSGVSYVLENREIMKDFPQLEECRSVPSKNTQNDC